MEHVIGGFDSVGQTIADKDVLAYIEAGARNGKDFLSVIEQDSRYNTFYHLSDYRCGLLAWYDFTAGSRLLELGAEFGALTGLFCESCGQVIAVEGDEVKAAGLCTRHRDFQNLQVIQVDWQDYVVKENEALGKFDYIVLAGGLECVARDFKVANSNLTGAAAMVQHLLGLLTDTGRLLMAVDNRFGLRYFCGEAERHTGRPFAGISRDMQGGDGQPFSRQEILEVIHQAGARKCKLYYPLPDWRFPQLVYTDEYLPEDNLNERLLVFHPDHSTLLANEKELYSDVVRNGVFPFFANSFLLECGHGEVSSIVYAALSTDRGRDKALATVLYADDRAVKRPIFNEGRPYAKRIVEQADRLRGRGLPVLSQSWFNGQVEMPRMQVPMLSSHLKQVAFSCPEEFYSLVEELWHYILRSSETVPDERNALPGCLDRSDENWGPILAEASLELIPLNAFYTEQGIVFFDQEYVRANYPAKYVLFRAIKYIYVFSPYIESAIPMQSLLEKYGISETMWQVFLHEENECFLPSVRQHEKYRHFYSWLQIDREQMHRNALLLGLDAEYSPEYVVSDKMQGIWQVQYGLLGTFQDFCRKHGLTYYVFFGTLLGAVRHRGFIPWDDDVDVVMPRADYDRMIAMAAEFPAPYFLQTMENDSDTFYGGFCRLRNDATTGIGREDFGHDCHLGIWMDILPLDFCSPDKEKVRKKARRIHFWQSLLYAKIYDDPRRYIPFGLRTLHRAAAKILPHEWLCAKLQAALHSEIEQQTDYLAIFTNGGMPGIYERSFFGEGRELTFGPLRVNAPKAYKRCLQLTAGRDFMKFPPMSKRKPHHLGIFNTEVPYTYYKDLFWTLFDGAEGRLVVLFGGGFMFEDYMKKYGRAYPPAFIVDNDEKKWGTTRQGVEIIEPKKLLEMKQEQMHLIICSIHYKAIAAQLDKMGVRKYKVYVQEREWILEDEQER